MNRLKKAMRLGAGSVWWLPTAALVFIGLVTLGAKLNVEADLEKDAERIGRLSEQFACPTCAGQSVGESNSAVSANIRRVIADEVSAGASDEQIREILIRDWGNQILTSPSADASGVWVWFGPMVLVLVGLAWVGATYGKRVRPLSKASQAKRVKAALALGFVFLIGVSGAWRLAGALGERGSQDSLTGSIELTTSQKLAECQAMANSNQVLEGIRCVDDLIAAEPDNSLLIANRGWFYGLAAFGAPPEASAAQSELFRVAIGDLDKALQLKPSSTQALAWRAIVNSRRNPDDGAVVCADIDRLYDYDPAPLLVELISTLEQVCA